VLDHLVPPLEPLATLSMAVRVLAVEGLLNRTMNSSIMTFQIGSPLESNPFRVARGHEAWIPWSIKVLVCWLGSSIPVVLTPVMKDPRRLDPFVGRPSGDDRPAVSSTQLRSGSYIAVVDMLYSLECRNTVDFVSKIVDRNMLAAIVEDRMDIGYSFAMLSQPYQGRHIQMSATLFRTLSATYARYPCVSGR
jgi:hypothetical protein